MKAIKFLALMLVALVGMTACNDDDNDGDGNNGPKSVNLNQKCYIFVSSNYFQDMYYGNNATLKIYPAEENQYNVEFHDPQWGDVTFENVTIRPQLSGTGTLSMNYRGEDGSYEAILSGTMMMPIISMPSVMGGTTITFYAGDAPEACQLEGKHNGTNSVMVGDNYGPYDVNATYSISANPDGTLNLTIPLENLSSRTLLTTQRKRHSIASMAKTDLTSTSKWSEADHLKMIMLSPKTAMS